MKEETSELGQAINELETQVQENLAEMFTVLNIDCEDIEKVSQHFIAASNSAGTAQQLIFEYYQRMQESNDVKVDRVVRKSAKKAETKKNRSRGKTSMKKA